MFFPFYGELATRSKLRWELNLLDFLIELYTQSTLLATVSVIAKHLVAKVIQYQKEYFL